MSQIGLSGFFLVAEKVKPFEFFGRNEKHASESKTVQNLFLLRNAGLNRSNFFLFLNCIFLYRCSINTQEEEEGEISSQHSVGLS